MSKLKKLSKLDIASNQIDTAIRLFFEDRDSVSTHTLIRVAYDLLCDYGRTRGVKPILLGNSLIVPGKEKEFANHLKKPGNFMKHANQDSEETLDFNPNTNQFLLLDAVHLYKQLAKKRTDAMLIFQIFIAIEFPDIASKELVKDISNARLGKIGKRDLLKVLDRLSDSACTIIAPG
jgi:hypothetical protein